MMKIFKYTEYTMKPIVLAVASLVLIAELRGQEILPPLIPWSGKSEALIARPDNKWITPAEKTEFASTPDYTETMEWLGRLCKASDLLEMTTIGVSAQSREIKMVIATAEKKFTPQALAQSSKPLLLIQAGIHSGEIDGKDAGMMLLRDVVNGSKKDLLDRVNLLFIPILSVDGHERSSPYNRVNQRGPSNMGWRTNARNLNLNRDYAKLDTEEIRAVIAVINAYKPDLYLDIHVTDGADYQYDITYGYSESYSPRIAQWLTGKFRPNVDASLKAFDHIPGPLVFAANDRDFSKGMVEFGHSTRFSNGYGDIAHLPTVLIENHSLKPFRQRVLGTYVFLEATIRLLASDGKALQDATASDRAHRHKKVVLSWRQSETPDTVEFLGIVSQIKTSSVTNKEYVEWTGKPITQRIPFIRVNTANVTTQRPVRFVVPGTYKDVIERLRFHGIEIETLKEERTVKATFFRVGKHTFSRQPFEGHFTVSAEMEPQVRDEKFYPGSVIVSTDQPLGDLAVLLLHPQSPDSFFQWGFFPEIFSRTEYIEQYAVEPLAAQMLKKDPALKKDFEEQMKNDPEFAKEPMRIYQWFYQRSPYFDQRWLLYPVAIIMGDEQ